MKFSNPIHAVAFLLIIHHSSLITSAQDWTLSTADFKTESVAVQAIDEKGVRVIPAGQTTPTVIPPANFLQLDRNETGPAESSAKFMLHLVTGDRVGGEPVKIENDALTWRNAAVGEIAIPLSQALAITKPDVTPDASKRTEDVVVLGNGDTVRGIVVGASAEGVQVKPPGSDDAPVAVPLEAMVSIQFASSAPATTAASAKASQDYRVRLADGSSVVATGLALADNKLALVIGGGAPRSLDLARVSGIEQVNGPVSWLTASQASEQIQIPFVGKTDTEGPPLWATRTNTDVAGQPFVIGGQTLRRGLGVHAYSRLVYPLDGSFKAFRTRYGINDSLVRSDVTVRIRLDGRVVHEEKNVRAGKLSPVVLVDLEKARELALEVDYGEGIDVEDRLNWIEPALLREKPKPAPVVPTTAPAKKASPPTTPAESAVPKAPETTAQ